MLGVSIKKRLRVSKNTLFVLQDVFQCKPVKNVSISTLDCFCVKTKFLREKFAT